MVPTRFERVILRRVRARIRMESVPRTATAKRQPNGVAPNRASPPAITHLPNGGCTTYSGTSLKMLSVSMFPSELNRMSLASSTNCFSYPNRSSEMASFA